MLRPIAIPVHALHTHLSTVSEAIAHVVSTLIISFQVRWRKLLI